MSTYFSDRELGARPRVSEVIEEGLWNGLLSLIEQRIEDGSFGYRFPDACSDSPAIGCGTDSRAFFRMVTAEIPQLRLPLLHGQAPETIDILDLLEFCCMAVGTPIKGWWHDYPKHHHMTWDRAAGLEAFTSEVNRLFARNGVAFEMSPEGKARRLLAPHLGQSLANSNFRTGDQLTDALLEDARKRFLAPKHEDRRDGLEKLWDAFERIKTLEPGVDKRSSASALLDQAASPRSRLRSVLEGEASALTSIGNNHRIRHSEVSQEPLETSEQVDFLFLRLFAFIHLLLSASNRLG